MRPLWLPVTAIACLAEVEAVISATQAEAAHLGAVAPTGAAEKQGHAEAVTSARPRNLEVTFERFHSIGEWSSSGTLPLASQPPETDPSLWRHGESGWTRTLHRPAGLRNFFSAAVAFEWMVFFTALICFAMLQWCLLDWPSTPWYHGLALCVWIVAAAMYAMLIWGTLGSTAGSVWVTGYFLELIFSVENVFIYTSVVEAFKTPARQTKKALCIVVGSQIVFQMVGFMGLAGWLQSIVVLPYILGLWLIFVGFQTLREDDHASFDVSESAMFGFFRACLGSRLSPEYREDGSVFFVKDNRTYVTMLGPTIACLLGVNFIMEVDVTLTKIEEISNPYIGYSSSVAAAFAVPTLLFVSRELFARFHLLKYGITFVLLFFGAELLLHQVIFIPNYMAISIIVAALLLCAALSKFFRQDVCLHDEDGQGNPKIPTEEAETKSKPAAPLEAAFDAPEKV